jgi:hypothetical protein
MPNYGPAKSDPPFATNYGNRCVFQDRAVTTAALAANDKVRLARVPAGTLVDRVVVRNPDLDTGATLVFRLGFEAIDGTVIANADIAVAAAGQTTWQAAATTTYEIFPPYLVTKDSFLTAVVNTGGATNTGTVYGKVEGEALGAK